MPADSAIRRPRLLWTLLGVLILVGVLPLVVSHYFLIGINRDSLETLEKKYLTRSAVGIARDIDQLVASKTQLLQGIAGSLDVTASLTQGGADPFAAIRERGLVSSYIAADPDLRALRIINRSGQGATAEPNGLDAAVRQEMDNALARTLRGQTYAGSFQYIEVLNQPALVLAVPVQSGQEIIGAISALVSLQRVASQVGEDRTGEVTTFIVDRTGRVLVHSVPSLNVQRPDLSRLPIVQEFKKAPVRLTRTYEDSGQGENVELLGTVAPVETMGWGVVVQKESSRAFMSVKQMMSSTILWVAVSVGLALVLGTLFAARISSPIRALAARSREIASGNYQQRVELTTRNEIGELAQNFNVMSDAIQHSIEQLKQAAHENNLLFINSVRMLAAAIDAKDPYTRGHSERVARYSIAIGKHLHLPQDQMRNLRISALLHDVGKIGIDDRILRKPGALSDEEFEVMKGHPDKGAAIMSGVAQLIDIIPGMKYHHEKWSGGGYPENLAGEQIPMQARIVAIADTFDAMTTNRPYQKAMELKYVVEKIKSFGGSRFDPRVVDAFVSAVEAGDIQVEEQMRGAA